MTYVSEQTPAELRAHMKRLQAMAGWHEPLADRLCDEVKALDRQVAELQAESDALAAKLAEAVRPTCGVGHVHFTPFYLMANCRRILSGEHKRRPNWCIAMDLFAMGSNSAYAICIEAGIDPDGLEVRRAAAIVKEHE